MGLAPVIECRTVSRRYGAELAIDGVDLRIDQGEVVALVGLNGAGKSTLIELMSGLQFPTQGDVRVFGKPPRDAISAGTFGTMLQNGALLRTGRVISLVKLMRGIQRTPLALNEVIAQAGIQELLDKRVSKLSGGEAQRVRYALAIMSSPAALLLDEPTVGMDIEVRHQFWEGINSRRNVQTILYTTHQLEEADRWADRVLVLAHGRLIADKSPGELRESLGLTRIDFSCPDSALIPMGQPIEQIVLSEHHVEILTHDSNAVVRLLMDSGVAVTDLQISAPSLETALTSLLAQHKSHSGGVR